MTGIVMVVYDEGVLAEYAVRRLRAMTTGSYVLAVVGNGSPQETANRLYYLRCCGLVDKLKVLDENVGLMAAQDAGLRLLADWELSEACSVVRVVFTQPDVDVVDGCWLKCLKRSLDCKHIGAVGPVWNPSLWGPYWGWGYVDGCCVMMSSSVLRKVAPMADLPPWNGMAVVAARMYRKLGLVGCRAATGMVLHRRKRGATTMKDDAAHVMRREFGAKVRFNPLYVFQVLRYRPDYLGLWWRGLVAK